jgi:hypothetical protein
MSGTVVVLGLSVPTGVHTYINRQWNPPNVDVLVVPLEFLSSILPYNDMISIHPN